MVTSAFAREVESHSPASLHAERLILGNIVEDSSVLSAVLDAGVAATDFSLEDHRRIFMAILALRDSHTPIDYLILSEKLGGSQDDYVLVGSLIDGVLVNRSHVLHHIGIVRERARLRELIRLGEWLISSSIEPGANAAKLTELALEKLSAIGVTR